jgi:hypothetical protein
VAPFILILSPKLILTFPNALATGCRDLLALLAEPWKLRGDHGSHPSIANVSKQITIMLPKFNVHTAGCCSIDFFNIVITLVIVSLPAGPA